MDRREELIAKLLIWVVAVASFATQMLLTAVARAWSWDEAIYLSQVTREADALPFAASRARGITLLVAPLASMGAPGWAIRVCLAAGSSLVLALVFRAWVPRIGIAAAIGAFLFAASWPALFYGSEVMPNLWAALFGVGLVAYLARSIASDGDGRGTAVALLVFAVLMTLMRPPDALVLALALTLAVAALDRGSWRALVPMLTGVALGWVPWLVEMSVRFGGPVEAIRSARAVSHVAGSGTGLLGHLALTDGPLLGPDSGAIPAAGALWWTGLLVLTVLALMLAGRNGSATDTWLAAIGGAALALEYLVLVTGLAPRFLLPGLALFSLTAGRGLDAARRAGTAGRSLAIAAAAALAVWTVWQVETLREVQDRAAGQRAVPRTTGLAIRDGLTTAGLTDPCLILSDRDYPQIAFAAGCRGRQSTTDDDEILVQEAISEGSIVIIEDPDPGPSSLRPQGSPAPGWFAFRGIDP